MSLENIAIHFQKCQEFQKSGVEFSPPAQLIMAVCEYFWGNRMKDFECLDKCDCPKKAPKIPNGFISPIQFERKYGLANKVTIRQYCRRQDLSCDAYVAIEDHRGSVNYYVDARKTLDFLLTKTYFINRVKNKLYHSALEELLKPVETQTALY